MIIFEQQRVPYSKKNKEWRKNNVNSICSHVDDFSDDWYRMWQNYRLKNNQIDQSEFREYCDTLGLKRGEGKKFVEPFNKTHIIVDVLIGEEAAMPWNFDVLNISPKATNEMLRQKKREIMDYVDSTLANEVERVQAINQKLIAMKTQGLDPQTSQQQIEQINAEFQKREEALLNPTQIAEKYTKYKSLKEVAMHKLLRSLSIINNLKWVKNQTFEDAIIAGVEAVEIVVDHYTGMPKVKQLNPLTLFFHKSSDTPFIQNSEFAGYKEELTPSEVLDKYGDDLDEKDIKRLTVYNNPVYGTEEKFHSKNGESVNHWDHRKQFDYTNRNPFSTIPSYSGSSNIISDGLYASGNREYHRGKLITVYTVYWLSQRKVGKLEFINEYGEPETTIVGEQYKVPKDAEKIRFKKHLFSRSKSRYEWEENGKKLSLEWMHIPEVWKGVRIHGDIYCKIEPYEHAYQSLLNPYKVKLPIHGLIYNNRNATSVSIMDRIKPWQKLYFVVATKWLKLITQDKGVINLLNILMMDKDLGYKKSLEMAVDQGVLPYNPLAHSQGAGLGNTSKPAEALNLSNSDQLVHYTNMLQFIEQQLKMAAGISDSRLAQTSSSTNVTDNQRDMAQSMNITNGLFKAHELLWQEILQSLCETAARTLNSRSEIIRQVLSDEEIALIDLDLISLDDEYAIRVGNNIKAHEVLMQVQNMAQTLIQQDKAKLSTFIDLLNNTNLREFQAELKEIEEEIEQRETQMQEYQQKQDAQMAQDAAKEKEADRQHELDKIRLKAEYDIKISQIKAMSWNPDKDMDRDGLPDIFELEKFANEAEKLKNDSMHEGLKIAQKDRELALKEQEMSAKSGENQQDRNSQEKQKQADIKSKERISKDQEKTKRVQAAKKATQSKS